MKAMDLEKITRPTAASKNDTLLLRENAPNAQKQVKVRLFYSDGRVSDVVEVDAEILSEKSKQFCTQLREPWVFIFTTHRFLKVNDLDEILIMMKLMGHDILTTPADAAKRLHIRVEDVENLIAQGLVEKIGGNVWLDEVKKRIDEGYTGSMTLVK